jgi:hypothetical protein
VFAVPAQARSASHLPAPMSSITQITLVGGERQQVQGDLKAVERLILAAARGSIMELAWFTDARTGESIGINPECVVMIRAAGPADC